MRVLEGILARDFEGAVARADSALDLRQRLGADSADFAVGRGAGLSLFHERYRPQNSPHSRGFLPGIA